MRNIPTTNHFSFAFKWLWLDVDALKSNAFFISHLRVSNSVLIVVCDEGYLSLHADVQAALVILEVPVLAHISILAKNGGLNGTLEGLLVQACDHLLLPVDLLLEMCELVLVDVLLPFESDVLFFETL